jgi:hypothetical protein
MQESSTTTTTNTAAQLNPYGDEMSKKVNALGTLLLKEVAQSKQALALYVINNLITEAKNLGGWERSLPQRGRKGGGGGKVAQEHLRQEVSAQKEVPLTPRGGR